MRKYLLSVVLLASVTAFSQTTPPAPLKGAVVSPKESTSSLKLELNRSRYLSAVNAFQEKQQQAFYLQLKPILDSLDSEEKILIQQVRTDNGWNDSYQFDNVSGQWKKVDNSEKTNKK